MYFTIKNVKPSYYPPKVQKYFVRSIQRELECLVKDEFSARQYAFYLDHQKVLKKTDY
jgi:hypothetical protein